MWSYRWLGPIYENEIMSCEVVNTRFGDIEYHSIGKGIVVSFTGI